MKEWDTANDKSGGTAYDGTLTNNPTWLANGGPFGGPCLSFNSDDSNYINFSSDIKNFFHNTSFTVVGQNQTIQGNFL